MRTNMNRMKIIPKNQNQSDTLDIKFFKTVCRVLYYFGLGDYCYEDQKIIPKYLYAPWSVFNHIIMISFALGEVLGNFRNDLTVKERNDVMQLSIAHPTLYLKVVFLMWNKEKIKHFFKVLLKETRIKQTNQVEKKSISTAKKYIVLETITMIIVIVSGTIDGILVHNKEGIPIRTLVTVWPGKQDQGIIVEITRVLVQLYWWYILSVMVSVDAICVIGLVFLRYRFKSLQIYFEDLRDQFLKNSMVKRQDELEKDMQEGLVKGIKMHSKTLWCARSIQGALGNVYSLQVAQSITLFSICLIKLVRLERSLSIVAANFGFMSGLLALTGTYMLPAGDLTIEAAKISTSIFYSGWELCRPDSRMRPLYVVAIQCSNTPVIMTAFGVYGLSHSNFISVLRTSYSFFTVMY